MNSNPTFSRIAGHIRNNPVPGELKNKLLLLFYRMNPTEQSRILEILEKNTEALPVFAEFITELEQKSTNMNDTAAIENLLERYLDKLK